MAEIRWPFAQLDAQTLTAGATVAATVTKSAFLTVGSAALTAGFTFNLTLGDSLIAGDVLYVSWLSDGTARSLTPGTGFKGTTAITGTISKTQTVMFVYDGSAFHALGSLVQ